jgi:BirA family biotin operon repressor/biotin-[acetyl-CoA-carboxylase] ligase
VPNPSGAPGSAWSDLTRPPLSAAALRRALVEGDRPPWRVLDVVAETESTNADVAARARAGEPAGYVLVADHQSAGRGRLERTWTTPPRAALAISVLLRPRPAMAYWSWLPQLAGVALVDALTRTCGLSARLKWPNDVLLPDDGNPRSGQYRKVCGILAEAVPPGPGDLGAVVLGAGINVSQDADELPVPTATSLHLAGSATTDRDVVARAYLRALAARYGAWQSAGGNPRASGLAAAYREMCLTIGQDVRVLRPAADDLRGHAEGVDDDGRLLVRDAGGRLSALAAGDVVHVR